MSPPSAVIKVLRRCLIRYLIIIFMMFILAASVQAATFTVKVSKAHIRFGPGTDYGIAWKVTKGYPLKQIKKKGAWIKVRDAEGDEGWIHQSLIQPKDLVVIKVKIANIRKEPSTKSPIIMKCERGVVLRVLDRKKGWLQVQHADGEKGWLYGKLGWR